MKTLLALVIALCAITTTVEAQTIPASTCTIGWTASPTPDVTSYNLYIQKEGVQMPTVNITAPATTLTCKAAAIQTAGKWAINLSAVNPAGESVASNTVNFAITTSVIPLPPSLLFIK
jgi:hypothetical protein